MVLEKILEFCQYWTIFAPSEIYPFIKKGMSRRLQISSLCSNADKREKLRMGLLHSSFKKIKTDVVPICVHLIQRHRQDIC